MVGEGRRDLRRHTKPGALKKGHRAPSQDGGRRKTAAMALLFLAGAGALLMWLGWELGGVLARVLD